MGARHLTSVGGSIVFHVLAGIGLSVFAHAEPPVVISGTAVEVTLEPVPPAILAPGGPGGGGTEPPPAGAPTVAAPLPDPTLRHPPRPKPRPRLAPAARPPDVAVPARVAEVSTPPAPPAADPDPSSDPASAGGNGADIGAGAGNGDGTGGGGGAGAGNGAAVGTPAVPLDDGAMRRLPYTRAAVELNISGDVVMDILVDEAGRVSKVHPRNRLGYGLDEIAVREVKKIPFRPARDAAGRPIAFWFRWNVHFYPPVR